MIKCFSVCPFLSYVSQYAFVAMLGLLRLLSGGETGVSTSSRIYFLHLMWFNLKNGQIRATSTAAGFIVFTCSQGGFFLSDKELKDENGKCF